MSRNQVLGAISQFNKSSLKPTTTVVRNTVITDNAKVNGVKDDVTEYIDNPQEIKSKVKALAELIRNSKHLVVYTGAGISTSAKIPDYRGPEGAWTLASQGRSRAAPSIEMESAIPTYAHMALVALANKGLLKHVVSTNLDGLHMRSGLDENHLSELHGNCYKEKCSECGKTYLRSFDVSKKPRSDHLTGRLCDDKQCGGQLKDSIINFGENLPVDELSRALEHSKAADLALVLGTSMVVRPACELPSYSYKKNNGKMVICNKQKTPYDSEAASLIHADLDDIFVLLMQELGIEVATETPEGLPVPKPSLKLEEKHTENVAQNAPKGSFLSGVLKTHRIEVANHTNDNFSVEQTRPNTFVYFSNCNDSQFTIPRKAGKVVINNCKNTTITLESGLTAGTLEVVNCENVAIKFFEYVPTITVDLTSSCHLIFETPECMKDLVTAKCSNLRISFTRRSAMQEPFKVPTDSETVTKEEWEVNQYITRRNEKNELFTEKVIRVGGGYVSTVREDAIATEKERINQEKFARLMRTMVR